jgi:hypothetical protein
MWTTDTRSELGARFVDLTVFVGMRFVLRGRTAWTAIAKFDGTFGSGSQTYDGLGVRCGR